MWRDGGGISVLWVQNGVNLLKINALIFCYVAEKY